MDLTGVRSEPHVAQQRRRERLRVQQINSVQSIPTDDRQFLFHSEFRPDLGQVGNASPLVDQSLEMIGFSSDFNAQSDTIGRQQMSENTLFRSRSISSNFNLSSEVQQQAGDWMLTYGSSSWSAENNPNLMISGEVGNASGHQPYLDPSYSHNYNFPGDHLPEPDRRRHEGETQFGSPPFRNTLQDVVIPASIRTPASEYRQGRWSGASELASFPSFQDQEDLLRFENSSYWVDRSVQNTSQQGLSLSLSSNPPSKSPASQLEDGCGSEDLEKSGGFYNYHKDPVAGISKPSGTSKRSGKSIPEIIGVSSNTCRNTGPLGPFTGYSIILKRSKFLKPAQQLLDQICGKSGLKSGRTRDALNRTSGGEVSVSVSADVSDATATEALSKGFNLTSSSSSSIFYGSYETSGDKARSFFSEPARPEIQRKKAKLLCIMEEVCRRYRQYNQQMQMAVSSFESVAGIGSAMPFMSFALKTVSRQFKCLKNVVSDQLRHVRRGGAEELTSHEDEEGSSGRMRGGGESLDIYGYGGGGDGFRLLQPHQHLWKPQRGLPERAVVILRAWLFEHFLHPYPTDADKLMLATQTGLSRNQVSNWFINARVRVWKPMVEEIHILEAKDHSERGIEDQGQPLQCLDEDNPWFISSHEKRSRVENEEPSPASFNEPPRVGLTPYDSGVSLTLGLRHGVENSQQQLLLQQHQNQLRRQCGGRFVRDFAG